MIDIPTNTPKRTWQKWTALSIVAVIVVGGITFTILKLTGASRNAATTTSSSATATKEADIDSLKSAAFDKLKAGDQTGGIKDLEQALSIAEASDNKEQISYFEQQIDFAKNSALSNTKDTTPTAPPKAGTDPQQTTFKPTN